MVQVPYLQIDSNQIQQTKDVLSRQPRPQTCDGVDMTHDQAPRLPTLKGTYNLNVGFYYLATTQRPWPPNVLGIGALEPLRIVVRNFLRLYPSPHYTRLYWNDF